MIDIGLVSYGIAALSYGVLATLLLRQWKSPVGPSVFLASLLTASWAGLVAWGTTLEYPPIAAMQTLELCRNGAWLLLLLQLNSLQSGGNSWTYSGWHWRPAAVLVFGASLLILWVPRLPLSLPVSLRALLIDAQLSIWLLLSIAALLLVEQLYRNASPTGRWSSKFICLGIGAIFAYDFFMYAEALLFRQLNAELWRARGLVLAAAVPWLAVGMVRHQASQIDLHVSRQVVFHSVTLVATGLYLLCMALIGYYLRYKGGDWGGVLQLAFLATSSVLLLSILFSGRVRANVRVFLDKHFFSYRYDYREEWLKFTESLARLSDDVPRGIIEIMCPLVGSSGGLLFAQQQERFTCIGNYHLPITPEGLGNVPAWLKETGWVVDLNEWRRHPEIYNGLEIPDWLAERDDLWLLVPLVFRDQIISTLVLNRAELKDSLNWEDRDLLKTAGRQAATHLAQYLASQALVEARQFDAFNRLSAYVVHDLKNILAQQSLLIANADRHKHNPAFVDDMLTTVANSVNRMQRLMEQMRSGLRGQNATTVQLDALLSQISQERSSASPTPTLDLPDSELRVTADAERLGTVFAHLIQNAQEATAADGQVSVEATQSNNWVTVSVEDSGSGMSEDFVQERLFRPFDSTKGLTGMGIGAFESREYIRQLGGDIRVRSKPGEGSVFTVTIPSAHEERDEGAGGHEGSTEEEINV